MPRRLGLKTRLGGIDVSYKENFENRWGKKNSGLFGVKYHLEPDELSAKAYSQDSLMLYATWGIFFGLSLIVQPDSVWAFGYYDTAKYVPYSPDSWGAFAIIGGLAAIIGMLSGRNKFCIFGCGVISVWNFFFAFSFLREALFGSREYGFSPAITYAFMCLWGVTLVSTYRKRNVNAV